MSENPAIRMMVSSPDGTEESRSPDDYAVLKNTAFLKARDRALESGQQEIAGPFLLADGSTAAAIISPAFTGDGSSTPRGYTASLVDFTVLQKDADFGAITRSGFRYSSIPAAAGHNTGGRRRSRLHLSSGTGLFVN